jgi:hypothetical protein
LFAFITTILVQAPTIILAFAPIAKKKNMNFKILMLQKYFCQLGKNIFPTEKIIFPSRENSSASEGILNGFIFLYKKIYYQS